MNFNSIASSQGYASPKRVCMIAYTKYRFDGRVRLEAESLTRWGYEVAILVPKEAAIPQTYTLAGVTVKELNVEEYGGKNKLTYILSYTMFLCRALLACTRLFFQSRIGVVHVHSMPDLLVYAGVIPRLFKCKLVIDLHDTVPETYQAKFGNASRFVLSLLRLAERASCFVAHQVICVNHVQRQIVIKRGIPPGKIATVITMPRFVSQVRCGETPKHEPVFRMVNHGTMSTRLGNDLIIKAAAQLVHEIPGFELHFIGGGDNLQQMLLLSRSLGVENYLHFHEGVPWDKLAEKLRFMDVGIVANRVNAATDLMLPSKLIDYVVLGIPAIVPRLRAIEYYFSEEMVAYFTPEDVDSIVGATISLYRSAARRERQASNAKTFLSRYQWDDRKNGLRALYDKLFDETTESIALCQENHKGNVDPVC